LLPAVAPYPPPCTTAKCNPLRVCAVICFATAYAAAASVSDFSFFFSIVRKRISTVVSAVCALRSDSLLSFFIIIILFLLAATHAADIPFLLHCTAACSLASPYYDDYKCCVAAAVVVAFNAATQNTKCIEALI